MLCNPSQCATRKPGCAVDPGPGLVNGALCNDCDLAAEKIEVIASGKSSLAKLTPWPEIRAAAAERALDRQARQEAIENLAALKFKKSQQVGHGLSLAMAGMLYVVQPFLVCDRQLGNRPDETGPHPVGLAWACPCNLVGFPGSLDYTGSGVKSDRQPGNAVELCLGLLNGALCNN
eukprot:359362-Chlamydomonas_euryale.AAC.11